MIIPKEMALPTHKEVWDKLSKSPILFTFLNPLNNKLIFFRKDGKMDLKVFLTPEEASSIMKDIIERELKRPSEIKVTGYKLEDIFEYVKQSGLKDVLIHITCLYKDVEVFSDVLYDSNQSFN